MLNPLLTKLIGNRDRLTERARQEGVRLSASPEVTKMIVSRGQEFDPSDPRSAGPVSFLFGRLTGKGRIKLAFGLLTISFDYEGRGEFSEENSAVYYDVCQTFPSGRRDERAWVIYSDHTGHLAGKDAKQQGSMIGRWTRRGFEFSFSCLVRISSKLVVRVAYKLQVEGNPVEQTSVQGTASLFGVPVARIEVDVVRSPAVAMSTEPAKAVQPRMALAA